MSEVLSSGGELQSESVRNVGAGHLWRFSHDHGPSGPDSIVEFEEYMHGVLLFLPTMCAVWSLVAFVQLVERCLEFLGTQCAF
jgi:hypothetical protein